MGPSFRALRVGIMEELYYIPELDGLNVRLFDGSEWFYAVLDFGSYGVDMEWLGYTCVCIEKEWVAPSFESFRL